MGFHLLFLIVSRTSAQALLAFRVYRELEVWWEEGFLKIDCSKTRIVWRDRDEKAMGIFGLY